MIVTIPACSRCLLVDAPAYGRGGRPGTVCTVCENKAKAKREREQRAAKRQASEPSPIDVELRASVSYGTHGDDDDPATLRALARIKAITDEARPVLSERDTRRPVGGK